MPMMPFSGVRISCDIAERKRVFSRFAVSAAARAFSILRSNVEAYSGKINIANSSPRPSGSCWCQ